MARQSSALHTIWNREDPRVIGAVRVMSCPEDSQIIALVPGANLLVLHSPKDSLICLDTGSAKSLGIISVGTYLIAVSHPYEEEGKFMFALATGIRKG